MKKNMKITVGEILQSEMVNDDTIIKILDVRDDFIFRVHGNWFHDYISEFWKHNVICCTFNVPGNEVVITVTEPVIDFALEFEFSKMSYEEFTNYIDDLTDNGNCDSCAFYHDDNCKCQCTHIHREYKEYLGGK